MFAPQRPRRVSNSLNFTYYDCYYYKTVVSLFPYRYLLNDTLPVIIRKIHTSRINIIIIIIDIDILSRVVSVPWSRDVCFCNSLSQN